MREKYRDIYKKYFPDISDNEVQVNGLLCPFHDDKNRGNLSVNLDTGVYHCFACGASGNIESFVARVLSTSEAEAAAIINKDYIDSEQVEIYHRNLLGNDIILDTLINDRCLALEIVNKYKLGYDPVTDRITIPISNGKSYINIRKYKMNALIDKYIGITGHNSAFVFPYENLNKEIIYIAEGEMDALAAISAGIPAVTSTIPSKISVWEEVLIKLLNKTVYLLYDNDVQGRTYESKTYKLLCDKATVIPVNFPQDGDDITSFIKREGKKAFHDLIKNSVAISENVIDKTYTRIKYNELFNPNMQNTCVEVKASVIGTNLNRYSVIKEWTVECPCKFDFCKKCMLSGYGGIYNMDNINYRYLLRTYGIPDERKDSIYKEILGIPRVCNRYKIVNPVHETVTEYFCMQDIVTELNESVTDTQIKAIIFGLHNPLTINTVYVFRGTVTTDPKTQSIVLLVDEIEEIEEKTPASYSGVVYKFKDMTFEERIEHLSENIGIRGRRDLVIAAALAYHTPLEFIINDMITKCALDILIIGDTTTGKTETFKRLQHLYGVGNIISGEGGTNIRGIIGGVVELGRGNWIITWGALPKAHKKILIIDEFQDLYPEIIEHLSKVRREGIAEITKITSAKTSALARLVCIANPRENLMINEFGFGIQAINKLIYTKQDIARFDFALIISKNEVEGFINQKPVIDAELYQQHSTLIKNIWCLKPNDVIITKAAYDSVLEYEKIMNNKYDCDIPLIDGATTYKKILRIAAGVAGIMSNFTSDNSNLIIDKEHVDIANSYLNEIYEKSACSYYEYADVYRKRQLRFSEQEIEEIFIPLPISNRENFYRNLLINQDISNDSIKDFTGLPKETIELLVSKLINAGALIRKSRSYKCTSNFLKWLRTKIE